MATLDDQLLARVERVVRLTPTIVEVIVRAPAAARHFHPGQFYRLQNFERLSPHVRLDDHVASMLMEGIALTGAWVDREQGLLSLITLEMGVSSRLCAYLKPGEPVVVMGPTGTPTEIPEKSAVLLAGGGLGNAVLFSIAKALKAQGNRVIYFAGYKNGADLFKREEIEGATDQVIWATDAGDAIAPGRPQDAHFRGNIVQAMVAYAEGQAGRARVPLEGRHPHHRDRLRPDDERRARWPATACCRRILNPNHVGIGSINSPMQCMMKEVCAQCLQRHVDPATGREEFIFSCYNQDQELDRVDFANLQARLRQNSVQEKLSNLWFEHMLDRAELPTLAVLGWFRLGPRLAAAGSGPGTVRPYARIALIAPAPDRSPSARSGGGMGQVYRAPARPSGRRSRHQGDADHAGDAPPELHERFLRESRACAQLRHPNIVGILDFGVDASRQPYMVMELLSGPSLGEEIWTRGADAAARVAAHPRRGGRRRCRLAHEQRHHPSRSEARQHRAAPLRVGRSRLQGDRLRSGVDQGGTTDATRLTDPNLFIGTMAYAAPEQIRGDAITAAADIYALGVIAYEMLTGVRPFERHRSPDAAEPGADRRGR